MTNYQQQIDIIKALRRAFEKFKHYKDFSNRARLYIQEELPANYTFSIDVEHTQWGTVQYKCRVWGNGILFNDSVYLSWSDTVDSQRRSWQEGFLSELDRADMSDYQERERDEERLLPQLEDLNAQVERSLALATKLIEGLPIPSSAKLRDKTFFWDKPSPALRKKFPALFDNR
jgi:hypothetical protein